MKSGPVSIARLVKVAMITLACGAVAFTVLLWPLIRPHVDNLTQLQIGSAAGSPDYGWEQNHSLFPSLSRNAPTRNPS